jgi:hypothetical protein
MADAPNTTPFPTEQLFRVLAVAGPLLASSIAITYDVGFFSGVGIGFFTFFSLSEHFVFALQSFPFAIPIAMAIIGWFFGGWLGYLSVAKFITTTEH